MALNTRKWLSAASGLCLLAGTTQAQSFQDNTSDIPQGSPGNNSSSENVDFADVDNDGDWDAVFSDGGDDGNDQNRIWINQGGDQGGTLGVFLDRTAAQFPSISDTSRDIEFADIDMDGDSDIYISNTSTQNAQSNRWWINQGGLQGGTVGFYEDDPTRWVGLDVAPTSIPSSSILSDGFVDWSCDCDFGDLDNDGDLDLVHSSYGGEFGGQVPTRIFLNDGTGFFSEFNPSGFRLPGVEIDNGDDGLWCDGTQAADTTNSNGTFCDIASSALDIDLGDIDGDYDLDILHGARQEPTRMFANRLESSGLAPDNGGALGFRDVSGAVFPANWSFGNGHYEQEMGDLDGDGDLDIYGLNWQVSGFNFTDITLRNNGNGTYGDLTTLSGSNADDNEGDFIDYDNDGDLDLYVCNFQGQDKMYRNENNGGSSFSYTNVTGSMPSLTNTGLDADVCDVDGDGDYDIFVANDDFDRNYYLKNTDGTADTTAPYLPNIERADSRQAGPDPTIVRVQVYDNAPYYITNYNDTWLEYTVNGGSPSTVPMTSMGGQLFRGEIPGQLTGMIAYRALSEDEYGNQGVSITLTYNASGGEIGTRFCSPAVPNSTGQPGEMYVSGSETVSDDDLVLTALELPTNSNIGYFIMGTGTNTFIPAGSIGAICVAPGIKRFLPPVNNTNQFPGGFNRAVGTMGSVSSNITAGSTWSFQAWHRDSMAGTSNLTDAISVTFN